MAKKNKPTTTNTTNQPALRMGTRIRCTDDGVLGRIVWANAVSVKIKWDDGEQVTWKRDSLTTRPIEILDDDDEQLAAPGVTEETTPDAETEQPAAAGDAEPTATTEQPQAEPETTPANEPTANEPAASEPAANEPTANEPATPTPEAAAAEPNNPVAEVTTEQPVPGTSDAATPTKPKRQRKTPAQPKEKKPSARDAAARVLAEAGVPLTCQEMIDAMAAKGYWTSPGGKTPSATLYSAILREIDIKGTESRFTKTERGKFARKV